MGGGGVLKRRLQIPGGLKLAVRFGVGEAVAAVERGQGRVRWAGPAVRPGPYAGNGGRPGRGSAGSGRLRRRRDSWCYFWFLVSFVYLQCKSSRDGQGGERALAARFDRRRRPRARPDASVPAPAGRQPPLIAIPIAKIAYRKDSAKRPPSASGAARLKAAEEELLIVSVSLHGPQRLPSASSSARLKAAARAP